MLYKILIICHYVVENTDQWSSVTKSRLQMSFKKSFLKISLISQENTFVLQAFRQFHRETPVLSLFSL